MKARRSTCVSSCVIAASTILWCASAATGAPLGLQWTDNATNETGFRIERSPSSSGTFTQIATVGTNITTYSDTTVTSGQNYCYRVQAFNSAGASGYTNVACATVAAAPATVTLTTTRAGSGTGTVTAPGINCGTDCSHSATRGTAVTLTATPTAGSTFTGWSGGGCSGTGSCTLTLLTNTTVTAYFWRPTYSVTVTKTGTGTGTVTAPGINCGTDCSHSATRGTAVTLTATPTAGSTFTGWSGGGCSGTGSCTLTLLTNTTVTAYFWRPTYSVTVTKTGTGTGTVTAPGINCGTDCSHSATRGTAVTLTATPTAGSTFTGWSGGGCSGTGSCTLTLLTNTTVTAYFWRPTYSVTVTKTGTGTGTVTAPGINCGTDCSHSATRGTAVTLTATPTAGSTFTGWSGGGCSGTGSCTVTVSANTVIGATFAASPSSAALEIVTGAEAGMPPRVQGFTRTGGSTSTDFLAYSPSFTGGVFVALGRLDSQGHALIVTGSGPGIPTEVRAFRADGSSAGATFLPYGKTFRGGARVAVCDVDGDGTDEIVTVPGPGRRPTVAVWRLGSSQTRRILNFDAGANSNTKGLFVACGDVDGDDASEIVVGYEQGGEPEIRLYRITGTRTSMVVRFLAYDTSFTGGVRVTTADVDGDGRVEVIAAPGPGGEPLVYVFKVAGNTVTELTAFEGAELDVTGGLHLAGGGRDALGGATVIVSPESASSAEVRVFSVSPVTAIETAPFVAGEPEALRGVTLGVSRP